MKCLKYSFSLLYYRQFFFIFSFYFFTFRFICWSALFNVFHFIFTFFIRVKNRLDSLTTSLIAWKQFENGLNEFKEVLGKDTGALKRLTGALEMGSDVVSNNLAHDVKEVAKRLSEKMDNHNAMASVTGQQVQYTLPLKLHCFSSHPLWKSDFFLTFESM